MVGVTSLPVRKDHDTRTGEADHANDLQTVLVGVLDPAVGNIEGSSPDGA